MREKFEVPEGKSIILVEYDEKDALRVFGYLEFIYKHTNAGNKVPARVLAELASMLTVHEDSSVYSYLRGELSKIKEQLMHRFGDDPKYDFTQRKRIKTNWPADGTYTHEFNFKEMVDLLFERLYDQHHTGIYRNKKELAYFIFDTIYAYRANLSRELKKHMSDFKMYAMTAFILSKMGFGMSSKLRRNHDYFQAIRQILHTYQYKKARK